MALAITGASFLLMALVMKVWPPKEINLLYGYRTRLSMSSDEAWQLAQKHSVKAMVQYGLLMIGVGMLTSLSFINDTYAPVYLLLDLLVFLPLLTILMIRSTHVYLKKKFEK